MYPASALELLSAVIILAQLTSHHLRTVGAASSDSSDAEGMAQYDFCEWYSFFLQYSWLGTCASQ